MINYGDIKSIDGEMFDLFVSSGAAKLKVNAQTVNDLNVFPIPDGDTGDNMFRTINGGVNAMKGVSENSVAKKSKALSDGMLLNARGNSGVILSQIFAGIAKGLQDSETADIKKLCEAFEEGVKTAYGAVVNPVEGTILTVAREAAEAATARLTAETTLEAFAKDIINEMRASLERTPDLLAVLKEAGVIDSGGAGLLFIAEGAAEAINGESAEAGGGAEEKAVELDFNKFTEDSVMQFGYCTEFLLRLQRAKTDVDNFDVNVIIDYLSEIGDSIVAFKTGTIVKVHVHTMTPHKVLEFCQRYGEFLTIKIENMTLQHNETHFAEPELPKVKKSRRKFGLCTVATGVGVIEVFKELGADVVIDGGQGKNPSTSDFVKAFEEIDADNIFVLPNNGNIIMAARQAAELYDGAKVYVVPSKNIGQAYASLSMLDYSSENADEIAATLEDDMKNVVTGMVCKAIRDVTVNGVEVKNDDYIGFTDKTMLASTPDKTETLVRLCEALGLAEKEFLTLVYGADATDEEKIGMRGKVAEKFPDAEIYEIDGKQEVYDVIAIIE